MLKQSNIYDLAKLLPWNSLWKYLRAKSCRLLSSKTFIVDNWQGTDTPLVSFVRDSCAFISNFEQVENVASLFRLQHCFFFFPVSLYES